MRVLDRFTSAIVAAWDSASARVWTRLGATSAVFATAPRRRALRIGRGLGVHIAGSITLSIAVGLMLWNDFGPGPLDVFIVALAERTGLPLALALWLTMGSLLSLAWALGRKPGVGSIATPIVMGPAIQLCYELFSRFESPSSLAANVAVQLVALVLIGVGAGAIIASGFGAGMGELLAQAASDLTGRPQHLVRAVCELTWLAVGIALGGPFGLGTIIVALAIGPAVGRGYRFVDGALVSTTATVRRQIRAHSVADSVQLSDSAATRVPVSV